MFGLISYPGPAKHKTSEDSNGTDDMDELQNAVPREQGQCGSDRDTDCNFILHWIVHEPNTISLHS